MRLLRSLLYFILRTV